MSGLSSHDLPRAFGPYELVRQLGVGGMAEVYVARARSVAGFEKIVALKTIHQRFSSDPEFTQLLVDEANITAQLSHRNIVQVIDLGQVNGTHYIAMEYVDGLDLGRLLTSARERKMLLSPRVAAYVAREIADGLEHAHKKNGPDGKPLRIVHRDVSPPNVLVSTAGEVKITDFGIAKASLRASRTGTGVVKGKYAYMAPEQAKALSVDHRADIFSLGCVLYELAVGKPVYPDMALPVLLDRVARAVFEAPERARPGLPPKLVEIIKKSLAAKAEERFQSARQMADALTDVLYTMPPNPEAELSALLAELSGSPSTPSIPPVAAGHSILDDDFDDSTQIESMSVLRSRMVAPLVAGLAQGAASPAPSTEKPTFRDEATRAFKRVEGSKPAEIPAEDDENATAAMRAPSKAELSQAQRSAPTIAPPKPGASGAVAKVRSPGAGPKTNPPFSKPAQAPIAQTPTAPLANEAKREAPTIAPPPKPSQATAAPANTGKPAAPTSAPARPAPPPMTKPAGFIAPVAPLQAAPLPPATLSDPPTTALDAAQVPAIPAAAAVPKFAPPAQPPATQSAPSALPVAPTTAPMSPPAQPQFAQPQHAQPQYAPPYAQTAPPMQPSPAAAYDPFAAAPQSAAVDLAPAPRSNTGIIVAGGFAVLGLIALVVVFVVTR
ncbi:MAG: protein kinase [Polyangiales bacterium]